MGRTVKAVPAHEAKATTIEDFTGLQFAAPTLIYALEKLGWRRGEAMDAGAFMDMYRHFADAKVTVFITWDGNVGMGYIEADEILTVERVSFYASESEADVPDSWYWGHKQQQNMILGDVDPLAYSETIYDLGRIQDRASGRK